MHLYTNTLPFDIGYSPDNKETIIPAGSTFGLVAVNCSGFILKPPKDAKCESVHVMIDIFKFAFKEVTHEDLQ